jgi:ribulose-phosphate 3-epimerase
VRELRLAPSLLSADFSRLREAIEMVEGAGVRVLHVDVMDGHFVPNITFGPLIVRAIRKLARSDLDVHLMISEPEAFLERFIEAGASYLTFHVEAVDRAGRLVKRAQEMGAAAGVVLNPETPLEEAEPVLETADLVVIMTVHPGFGGQGFIGEVVPKIRALYELREAKNYGFDIEVDGGISLETAPIVAWAGADILVAGAAVFKNTDPPAQVRAITSAALEGLAQRHDPGAFPLAPPHGKC